MGPSWRDLACWAVTDSKSIKLSSEALKSLSLESLRRSLSLSALRSLSKFKLQLLHLNIMSLHWVNYLLHLVAHSWIKAVWLAAGTCDIQLSISWIFDEMAPQQWCWCRLELRLHVLLLLTFCWYNYFRLSVAYNLLKILLIWCPHWGGLLVNKGIDLLVGLAEQTKKAAFSLFCWFG